MQISKVLLILSLIAGSFSSYSNQLQKVNQYYHKLYNLPTKNLSQRIEWFSKQFLETPYYLGSLGEGSKGKYDKFAKYSLNRFDCDTYVNTVLALAYANNAESFLCYLDNLRYKNGVVSYINRNHFTSLDWNLNNKLFLKDITNSFANTKKTTAFIDKKNWYKAKTLQNIRIDTNKHKALISLKQAGTKLKNKFVTINYLPLEEIYSKHESVFKKIPSGAVIEIVRPNWNLRKKIGTNLHISHLGFAIWKNNKLYFRQASLLHKKVVDSLFLNYLLKYQNSATVKGINIQIPQAYILKSCYLKNKNNIK